MRKHFLISGTSAGIALITGKTPTTHDLGDHPGPIFYHGFGLKASVGHYFGECGVVENSGDVQRTADFAVHVIFGCWF